MLRAEFASTSECVGMLSIAPVARWARWPQLVEDSDNTAAALESRDQKVNSNSLCLYLTSIFITGARGPLGFWQVDDTGVSQAHAANLIS